MEFKKSRMPLTIDKKNWIYHNWKSYILLVHQVYDSKGKYIQTDQFKIPKKVLEIINGEREE